jgi:hypothetical protein
MSGPIGIDLKTQAGSTEVGIVYQLSSAATSARNPCGTHGSVGSGTPRQVVAK